ncbi:AMP-dependent synthetase/ligase [Actinomadura hibisca]|uniref:AMP-dependent synthetase/ligase n=1 Tax=Actinomadura hibisca TaxID=68565 RepID=UPI0008349F1A|nr:AMP-binding protein [Actinomadura hibisca]
MARFRLTADRVRSAAGLCELFQDTVAALPDRVALRSSDGRTELTWRQYGDRVRRIAAGLHALGVRRGDTVGLMLTNRPEFHLIDTAAFHLGAVPFSVYNTSAAEQIAHLFGNAGNRVVVCEEQFLGRVREAAEGTAVERVVLVEDLADLEAGADPGFDFDAAWRAVRPDDLLTLIYTSGTTGPPKGVEITHGATLFSLASALEVPELGAALNGGRALSYLPDAHLANRWFAHYAPLAGGVEVTTVADLRTVAAVLPQVGPTVFLGVPALWYKIKAGVERAVAAESGPRARVGRQALRLGLAAARAEASGERLSPSLRARHRLADRLVLSGIRRRIGMDRALIAFTGAAPISLAALEFVLSLGVPIREAWSLTEASPVGVLNRLGDNRPGTVGRVMPGVETRLTGDGELLIRSPGLMRGYRGDPARTAEALDEDGWLHSGDLATIDADGYHTLIGRKKEIIINAGGKNMSPANIELAVHAQSPLIAHVVCVGDGRPYNVALIALDPEAGRTADDPEAVAEIAAAVARGNARLSRVEQIRKYRVLDGAWLPGDELTPTLKPRRGPIAAKYADLIEEMYRS